MDLVSLSLITVCIMNDVSLIMISTAFVAGSILVSKRFDHGLNSFGLFHV